MGGWGGGVKAITRTASAVKKKKERGGGIIPIISLMCVKKSVKKPSNNIVNINIAVDELRKIQTLDGQKRDGPLWAVHIKKNTCFRRIQITQNVRSFKSHLKDLTLTYLMNWPALLQMSTLNSLLT